MKTRNPIVASWEFEAKNFLSRCERSLEIARQVGDAAWKIEALEEAVADAKDALADLATLGA